MKLNGHVQTLHRSEIVLMNGLVTMKGCLMLTHVLLTLIVLIPHVFLSKHLDKRIGKHYNITYNACFDIDSKSLLHLNYTANQRNYHKLLLTNMFTNDLINNCNNEMFNEFLKYDYLENKKSGIIMENITGSSK